MSDDTYYSQQLPQSCCEAIGGVSTDKVPCALPTDLEIIDAVSHFELNLPDDAYGGIDWWAVLELFATAWHLLTSNWDLIQFLLCVFESQIEGEETDGGPVPSADELAECLEDLLFGDSVVLQGAIQEAPLSAVPGGEPVVSFDVPGASRIDQESGFFQLYVNPWMDAEAAGDTELQLCIALFLAGTLITELLHECGVAHDKEEVFPYPVDEQFNVEAEDDTCDFVGFIKNGFIDMMRDRYDCSFGGTCCENDNLADFGSDQLQNHPGSCQPVAAPVDPPDLHPLSPC